jgi:MATE family multidrug resistance protein
MRDAGLNKAILAIALPAMLTNVATALFGLADLWVIGRLGDAAAQGGVEVGAKLLMTLLIVFNFLRSSTVALAAQASGRGDEPGQAVVLVRAMAVGLTVMGAEGPMRALAGTYVEIRYWGGVPWLIGAVLTGWLIGRRRVKAILAIEVGANLFHVVLDVVLVLGLGYGVAGVAAATLASETAKCLCLAAMVAREPPARQAWSAMRDAATWRIAELGQLLRLNRDLFGRTVLLMVAVTLLTRTGAEQGPVVLAANAIMHQVFMLSALMLDGYESAAQVLCGEALGARDRRRFDRLVRAIMAWGALSAAAISLAFAVGGDLLTASFSTSAHVVATARAHVWWVVLLPVAGIASFVLDGVFIGSSWTRAMLLTMAAAIVGFLALLWAGKALGNHGLWLAYTLFFLMRAAGQALVLPGLARRSFSAQAS